MAPGEPQAEVRLPAASAVVVAIALYVLLPNELLIGPRWVIPAIEALLLLPLIVINPRRFTRETRWSRLVSVTLTIVLIGANLTSLGMLLHALTVPHSTAQARQLLVAALQIWLTNIIAFGIVFWELDRGGAVSRNDPTRDRVPDFRFPQDEFEGGRWIPKFIDYLYVSVTNSTAFSPTDTMPLTSRAKLLMSVQAMAALVTSLLVIARAVNTLQ